MKKSALTSRQLRAITCILDNSSIEESAKKAGVSRSTLYNWLNDSQFRRQLKKEREAIFEKGLNALKAATSKAANALIELLDCRDRGTRRLAAKEIINMAFKANEIKELEERISRLEEALELRQFRH